MKVVHKLCLTILFGLKFSLAFTKDIESPSQLYHEIHSNFDARNNNELEAITSPYNTRLSSHQQPAHLNLGDNWSDSTPAFDTFVDSSKSASHLNDNIGEMKNPGNYLSWYIKSANAGSY